MYEIEEPQLTKGKNKVAWEQDKKDAVVAAYEQAGPTPENSMEIVKEIAEEFEESPNGVRMVLSKAGVYVKKASAAGPTSNGTGAPRVSKAAAQDSLVAAISDIGAEIDLEIINKMTGKATVYFTGVLSNVRDNTTS